MIIAILTTRNPLGAGTSPRAAKGVKQGVRGPAKIIPDSSALFAPTVATGVATATPVAWLNWSII